MTQLLGKHALVTCGSRGIGEVISLPSARQEGRWYASCREPEEAAVGLGAVYPKEKDWGVHTVVDGQLITGQNPASSHEAAEALIAAVNQY